MHNKPWLVCTARPRQRTNKLHVLYRLHQQPSEATLLGTWQVVTALLKFRPWQVGPHARFSISLPFAAAGPPPLPHVRARATLRSAVCTSPFARTHKNPYTSSYWTHALCKPLPLHFKLYLCHNFSIILIVLANIYYTPFLTSLYTSFVLNCSLPLFFPFCQNTICLFL